MFDQQSFQELIERVRRGDADAAATLVAEYEPEIRRMARIRMRNPQLQRALDSLDVCQSVLGNFFARVAVGQFDIESPQKLLNLLIRLTRNKLTDHARRLRAGKRDVRKEVRGGEMLASAAANEETPSQVLGHDELAAKQRELLSKLRERMTSQEWALAEHRAAGRNWPEIGKLLGESPEALRKRLSRAVDRALEQLGLGTVGELDSL